MDDRRTGVVLRSAHKARGAAPVSPRVVGACVVGGGVLALLQPVPYAAVLAVNAAASPRAGRESPAVAFGRSWGDPLGWAAVVAFTLALVVMLARHGRPSGGYVGATIAVSFGAFLATAAVGAALLHGGGPAAVVWVLATSVAVYGTAWLAVGVAAGVCWWVRGRS